MTDNPLPLVLRALAFAAHKHRDQRRKDAESSPYINHPIALANVLANEGRVYDAVICAALLHDTIEDTETTPEELRAAFGDAIAEIVIEVTDDKALPKAERKRLQIEHASSLSRTRRNLSSSPIKSATCGISRINRRRGGTWQGSRIILNGPRRSSMVYGEPARGSADAG